MEQERVDGTTFKYLNGYAVETCLLIDKLKEGVQGDILSDAELEEICGRNTSTNGNGYGNLGSAIRYCERIEHVVWQRVRSENKILCLNDPEKLETVKKTKKHISKSVRGANRRAGSIDRSALNKEEQRQYDVALTTIKTVALVLSPSLRKKLELKSAEYTTPDNAKVLALFK